MQNVIEINQVNKIGSKRWSYSAIDDYAYAIATATKIKRGYWIEIHTAIESKNIFSPSRDIDNVDAIIYGAIRKEAERWAAIPEMPGVIHDYADRARVIRTSKPLQA